MGSTHPSLVGPVGFGPGGTTSPKHWLDVGTRGGFSFFQKKLLDNPFNRPYITPVPLNNGIVNQSKVSGNLDAEHDGNLESITLWVMPPGGLDAFFLGSLTIR